VMARGADRHERDPLPASFEGLQGGQACTRGTPGRTPRISTGRGVGVNRTTSLRAERGEPGQMGGVMDARQLLQRCLTECGRHDLLFGSQGAHALHDGDQARRPFGVAGADVVFGQADGPGNDERRHVNGVVRMGSPRRAWYG
jgi:hypothetical protein